MAFAQPASQTAAPLEALAGTVERVTYHNADNGFAVLKVQARGKRDLVTVVGHAASVMEGEWVTASGSWVSDRTHGVQFKAQTISATPPTGAEGIEKYLASGRSIRNTIAGRFATTLRKRPARSSSILATTTSTGSRATYPPLAMAPMSGATGSGGMVTRTSDANPNGRLGPRPGR